MPLYDFKCSDGHRFERHVRLENFSDLQNCACGSPAERVISAPMFRVDNTGYSCPVTGKWIGSRREHEENLKRTDCRVLETGEKELNEARRQAVEAEFDRKIEDTVEREIEKLPSHKKERLANELDAGITAEIVRN